MSTRFANITRPITSPVADPATLSVRKVCESGQLLGYALAQKNRTRTLSPVRGSEELAWADAGNIVRINGVGYLYIRPEQQYR